MNNQRMNSRNAADEDSLSGGINGDQDDDSVRDSGAVYIY